MARWSLALSLLLVAFLSGCGGGPNPLTGSDAEFEKYVKDRYAAEKNGAQLTEFKGTPLKTEGNKESRDFTAKSDSVTVSGTLKHDKSTGVVEWSLNFKYD